MRNLHWVVLGRSQLVVTEEFLFVLSVCNFVPSWGVIFVVPSNDFMAEA